MATAPYRHATLRPMKKLVLTFGLISGAILATITGIMLTLCLGGTFDFSDMEVVGYSAMVLSFLAVFFGIRTYRETHAGGAITFGKAFQVGILITLVSCAVYVIGWQIVYWNFIPDFLDRYAAFMIEKLRDHGASAAEIAAEEKKMTEFKRLYANPFFNVAITFLEVFPVGLVVTLVSAAILRKKTPPESAGAAAIA
jgi:hypothetical protein